ncbi:hypothetical protein [Novosphingobium sp.]|uniref:hypothetical protein n=1 Tax=Novosphingobium sp. TaxID=1874826 RepID=UPI0031E1C64D
MNPMIDEDHLFEGDSDFGGMIRGDATLAPGARLRMHGLVKGDIIVEQGAHVAILGMVRGDLVNHGGTIVVTGTVQHG